jgi:hypothetical protein
MTAPFSEPSKIAHWGALICLFTARIFALNQSFDGLVCSRDLLRGRAGLIGENLMPRNFCAAVLFHFCGQCLRSDGFGRTAQT